MSLTAPNGKTSRARKTVTRSPLKMTTPHLENLPDTPGSTLDRWTEKQPGKTEPLEDGSRRRRETPVAGCNRATTGSTGQQVPTSDGQRRPSRPIRPLDTISTDHGIRSTSTPRQRSARKLLLQESSTGSRYHGGRKTPHTDSALLMEKLSSTTMDSYYGRLRPSQ